MSPLHPFQNPDLVPIGSILDLSSILDLGFIFKIPLRNTGTLPWSCSWGIIYGSKSKILMSCWHCYFLLQQGILQGVRAGGNWISVGKLVWFPKSIKSPFLEEFGEAGVSLCNKAMRHEGRTWQKLCTTCVSKIQIPGGEGEETLAYPLAVDASCFPHVAFSLPGFQAAADC